jgi:hypothetical protein
MPKEQETIQQQTQTATYLKANLVVQTSLPIHLHVFQTHTVMGPANAHLLQSDQSTMQRYRWLEGKSQKSKSKNEVSSIRLQKGTHEREQ